MAIIKCKMCGAPLDVSENATVCACEYCGTTQTLPTSKNEVLTNLFNRANNLRMNSDFDKAQTKYEEIIAENPKESEAYWGIILCKYGIEYVEDPKTSKKIPTCHRTQLESVMKDMDYISAIKNADSEQKAVYEAEAKEIDRLQRDILQIVRNEKPFDVFICYKETDENGERTRDCAIAEELYDKLTSAGFRVFYAAVTLEDKIGQKYEPYIFAALNSAKAMLVIGSKTEYFEAVWVKNEWSRFIKLMKNDSRKMLIPCYRDMDAYDLPDEFSHFQAQDMSKIGCINNIVRVLKKDIQKENDGNINSLLKRAFTLLEDNDFRTADEYVEKVLVSNPECAEAYLAKLLVNLQVNTVENLKNCEKPIENDRNYERACKYGSAELKARLEGINKYIYERKCSGIYNEAERLMNLGTAATLASSLNMFKTIEGYKDSSEKTEAIKKKIKALEDNERAKVVKERRKRKFGKLFKFLFVLCCVLGIVVYVKFGIPLKNYNKGIAYMEEGSYNEAVQVFGELGDFKDSQAKIRECIKSVIVNEGTGGKIVFGDYHWLVLDVKEDAALIISDIVMEKHPYNAMRDAENKLCSSTWNDSEIRTYLNDDIYNRFSSSEKSMMIESDVVTEDTVVNADGTEYITSGGEATKDKLFLLSISEANSYFKNDLRRAAIKKASASYNNYGWWLRSPGKTQDSAAFVNYEGEIISEGAYTDMEAGIRPAMWIKFD